MKPWDWHQLWTNWNKENLPELWELEKIEMDLTIGRVIAWLSIIARSLHAAYDDLQRAAHLAARVAVLEQRLDALERRPESLARTQE